MSHDEPKSPFDAAPTETPELLLKDLELDRRKSRVPDFEERPARPEALRDASVAAREGTVAEPTRTAATPAPPPSHAAHRPVEPSPALPGAPRPPAVRTERPPSPIDWAALQQRSGAPSMPVVITPAEPAQGATVLPGQPPPLRPRVEPRPPSPTQLPLRQPPQAAPAPTGPAAPPPSAMPRAPAAPARTTPMPEAAQAPTTPNLQAPAPHTPRQPAGPSGPLPAHMLVTQPGAPGPYAQRPGLSTPTAGPAPAVAAPAATGTPATPTPAAALSELPASRQTRANPSAVDVSDATKVKTESTVLAAPAPLGRRLVAWAVDVSLIALLVGGFLAGAILLIAPEGLTVLRGLLAVSVPALLLSGVLAFVYTTLFGFLFQGKTPGRRVAGLRLVDATGAAPTPGRALLRAALSLVSFALFLSGFWLGLFDRRGQTLHDKLTQTFVVRLLDAT